MDPSGDMSWTNQTTIQMIAAKDTFTSKQDKHYSIPCQIFFDATPRWFSVGICKYKPGHKSHVHKFECSHWLKLQHSDWTANLVKEFFLNPPFSTRIHYRSCDL